MVQLFSPFSPFIMSSQVDNFVLLSLCGACANECPEGAMTITERGYRVMVGGHFGRWHHIGKELFKMGDEEKVFKALEASQTAQVDNPLFQ